MQLRALDGIEFHACSHRCRDRGLDERSHGRSLFRAGVLQLDMVVAALQRAARILLAIIYSATW